MKYDPRNLKTGKFNPALLDYLHDRECPKCHAKYPSINYAMKYCKWCKTPLPVQVCKWCGDEFPLEEALDNDQEEGYISRICPRCRYLLKLYYNKTYDSRTLKRRVNLLQRLNNAWYEYIKEYNEKEPLPREPIPTVNKRVNIIHGGCFFCHEPIEQFMMLIPPVKGGRYDTLNVIGLCPEHYHMMEFDENPLIAVEPFFNEDSNKAYKRKLVNLVTGGKKNTI